MPQTVIAIPACCSLRCQIFLLQATFPGRRSGSLARTTKLHPTRVAPDHAEVGAPPPQPILAVDPSAAVDDALQEGLELMMEAEMKKDDRPIL